MTTCIIDGWRTLPEPRTQVCEPCEIQIGQHLDLLADAAPLLAAVARNEPAAGRIPVQLLPLDLTLPPQTLAVLGPAEDQIGETPIATKLGLWVEDWTGRDVITADAVSCATTLRALLHDGCATHPAMDEFAAEVRGLVAAARRALQRDLTGTRYATPCPSCATKSLLRVPGADWIECGPCGRLWDEESYAELTLNALRAAVPSTALLPTPALAMVLGVKASRLRKAAALGRIQPYPGPWGGRRLFVLGECAAAMRKLKREKVS